MFANVEDVISWLELQDLQWWTVSLTKDDNTKVFDSIEDETLESRKIRFRDTMKLTHGNRFIIKAKKNKSDARGIFQDEFINNTNDKLPTQNMIGNLPQTIGITPDEVEERIASALDKERKERELKELRDENKELKNEIKEAHNVKLRFMQKLEPYIGMIAQGVVGKFIPEQQQISVAGIQTIDINNENSEIMTDEERIENALIKWSKADKDYITLLEIIAEMAHSKPDKYNVAKSFL